MKCSNIRTIEDFMRYTYLRRRVQHNCCWRRGLATAFGPGDIVPQAIQLLSTRTNENFMRKVLQDTITGNNANCINTAPCIRYYACVGENFYFCKIKFEKHIQKNSLKFPLLVTSLSCQELNGESGCETFSQEEILACCSLICAVTAAKSPTRMWLTPTRRCKKEEIRGFDITRGSDIGTASLLCGDWLDQKDQAGNRTGENSVRSRSQKQLLFQDLGVPQQSIHMRLLCDMPHHIAT